MLTNEVPTWAVQLLEDVRLESTMADLIATWVARGDITKWQAEELSKGFGVAYPYGWENQTTPIT